MIKIIVLCINKTFFFCSRFICPHRRIVRGPFAMVARSELFPSTIS